MRPTALLLLAFSMIAPVGCSRSPDDPVQRLFESQSAADAEQAAEQVLASGTAAFPALVSRLADPTPTANRIFQRESIDPATGQISVPTVGSACFDILQSQIEGRWPKSFREYYALQPATVESWLASHAGESLGRLRELAQAESLARIDAELAKYPHNQDLKGIRDFVARPYAARQ